MQEEGLSKDKVFKEGEIKSVGFYNPNAECGCVGSFSA